MRIQTSQLEAVHWIARLGSFRAAALHLNLSQPTISMRVRDLEQHLGVTLFDRSSYRAQLTEAGRELARYAERILNLAEEMEQHSARTLASSSPIRLGAADSFALTCLPELLSQLELAFPTLRIDLQIDFSRHLNQRLQRGELDIAFLSGAVEGPVIQVAPLLRPLLAWVASPRLKLPTHRVRPEDLRHAAVLSNPRPSHLFDTIQRWFASGAVSPARLMTCNSLTIMARLASAGFGVTLLPTDILRADFELGNLRPLRADPPMGRYDIVMAWRESMPLGLATAILDIAKRVGKLNE